MKVKTCDCFGKGDAKMPKICHVIDESRHVLFTCT